MMQNAKKTYREIRSRLVARGYTVRRWAIENGYEISSVYSAMTHQRHGKRSQTIRQQLTQFANE